jgi:hypothetical protein
LVKLKSSLRKFYGRHHDLVDRYGISITNDHGYVPLVVSTSRSFPHSWLIPLVYSNSSYRVCNTMVQLVEQELFTLLEHLSSPSVFSGVRVTRSLVLYACLVDRCLFLLYFFCWLLCCLSFFELRILITPLVPSNSS